MYTGCSSDPCKNGGACVNGVDMWICVCLPGYDGDDCSQGKAVNLKDLLSILLTAEDLWGVTWITILDDNSQSQPFFSDRRTHSTRCRNYTKLVLFYMFNSCHNATFLHMLYGSIFHMPDKIDKVVSFEQRKSSLTARLGDNSYGEVNEVHYSKQL